MKAASDMEQDFASVEGPTTDPDAIVLAGHSHMIALYQGWLERAKYVGAPDKVVTVRSKGIAIPEYWEVVKRTAEGRTLVVVLNGNQQNTHFLFRTGLPFDIIRQNRSYDSTLAAVPFEMAVSYMYRTITEDPVPVPPMPAIRRMVVVGTPPPKSDETVRRWLTTEDHYAARLATLGWDPASAPVSPLELRVALWEALQKALSLYSSKIGALFVPVPQDAQDETGALREEYSNSDVTHANAAYGALLWQEVAKRLAAEPGDRPARHPYQKQSQRAFWSRAVAKNFDNADVVTKSADPLITSGDQVVSAGSCFASNLVPYLEGAGFHYLRTETPHPAFASLPDNLGYRNFSAAYGNIYTARQLRQLLDRSLGLYKPAEDRWHSAGHVIDPFRPGQRYAATTDAEFDVLTQRHLDAVRAAFTQATVLVFTLGLTEAWISRADGAVFPACPGTIAGEFDPAKHAFKNFTSSEVRDDLLAFIERLRSVNPSVRLILTVSPVPLVATATDQHVLSATIYSKSALRVAAAEVCATATGVSYFPAYEIVTGPQAPYDFFEADRRDVSRAGVQAVMNALLAHCEGGNVLAQPAAKPAQTVNDKPAGPDRAEAAASPDNEWQKLSQALVEAECEEAMANAGN